MSWMESIAAREDREAAREKFDEWCQMKADVHEEIAFDGRHGDVARLHISDRRDTYFVRNYTQRYRGNPVRVIDVNPVDEETVELELLLAELRETDRPVRCF